MRQITLIIVLLICGCNSQPRNPFSAEITDQTGTNRLALVYVPVGPGRLPVEQAYEFHSLVWKTKTGRQWSDHRVITKDQFQAGSSRDRWVSEIYRLDSASGNSIIKVAEVFSTNGGTTCVYSWREWNLSTNAEVRLLRICKEPFEPFTGKRIKLVP